MVVGGFASTFAAPQHPVCEPVHKQRRERASLPAGRARSTAALLLAQPFAAIAGFALVGAGLAATFPITVSAAAERGDMAPGNAIAAIATLGYFGFMVGPPTIGAAAQALGLPVALALLPVLCLTIALLAHQTAPARTRPGLLRRVTP
jgi:MFS family permease